MAQMTFGAGFELRSKRHGDPSRRFTSPGNVVRTHPHRPRSQSSSSRTQISAVGEETANPASAPGSQTGGRNSKSESIRFERFSSPLRSTKWGIALARRTNTSGQTPHRGALTSRKSRRQTVPIPAPRTVTVPATIAVSRASHRRVGASVTHAVRRILVTPASRARSTASASPMNVGRGVIASGRVLARLGAALLAATQTPNVLLPTSAIRLSRRPGLRVAASPETP